MCRNDIVLCMHTQIDRERPVTILNASFALPDKDEDGGMTSQCLEKIERNYVHEQIDRERPVMIPTTSGALRDKVDGMINKRLEERIRQLQMIRAQIQDIQLKNKRDLLAKQIEVNKIVDKLRR